MEYDGSWSQDSEESSFEKMESGVNTPTVDFARIGCLYLIGGNWNGTQVALADWVTASTQDSGLIQAAPVYPSCGGVRIATRLARIFSQKLIIVNSFISHQRTT